MVATAKSVAPGSLFFFFFNDTATTEIYTLSLHDALPIYVVEEVRAHVHRRPQPLPVDVSLLHEQAQVDRAERSEEHTSELQSQSNLVCRLLLEKKNSVKTRSTKNHMGARASLCPTPGLIS